MRSKQKYGSATRSADVGSHVTQHAKLWGFGPDYVEGPAVSETTEIDFCGVTASNASLTSSAE